jgi:hypothetical protein
MGLGGPVSPDVATGFILIMAVLLAMTIANRVRKGLKETSELRISS